MDHRSGSASQGTSPLKAAGFLVGLLVVVALAFALGMKAGRELDVLRPERGGETVKLPDPKSEAKASPEGAAGAHRDGLGSKQVETAARAGTTAEPPGPRREPPGQPAHGEERAASAGSAAPLGDEPPMAASKPAGGAAASVPAEAPQPGPDYTIFRSAPGAAGAAKASAASPSRDSAPGTEPAAKAAVAKPGEATKPPKETAADKEAKVAAAKPAAPVATKPAAPSASSGQLRITPESQSTPDKGSPGFVVQVAALQSKSDADQLATPIRAHGATPYINKVELPNGTWYRVRVGKFKTTAEAKAAQKKLAAEGFRGAEVMSAR